MNHDATVNVLKSQNKFVKRTFCPYDDRTGSNVRSTVTAALFIPNNEYYSRNILTLWHQRFIPIRKCNFSPFYVSEKTVIDETCRSFLSGCGSIIFWNDMRLLYGCTFIGCDVGDTRCPGTNNWYVKICISYRPLLYC